MAVFIIMDMMVVLVVKVLFVMVLTSVEFKVGIVRS